MIPCENCGTMVPEMNITMHKLHCAAAVPTHNRSSGSGGRAASARRPTVSTDENDNDADDSDDETYYNPDEENDNGAVDVIDLSNSQTSSTEALAAGNAKRDGAELSSPPPRQRRKRQGRLKRDDSDDESDDDGNNEATNENIETIMDTDEENEAKAKQHVVDLLDCDDDDEDEEWSCPRCTLLNDNGVATCEACGGRNPAFAASAPLNSHNHNSSSSNHDGVRPPDPVRREQLIGDDSDLLWEDDNNDNGSSPLRSVGGGALFGGVLGAAGAYMRGGEIGRGALEGSVAGAVSGMFLNEVMRGSPDRRRRPSSSRQNRSNRSAATEAGYSYHRSSNDLDNSHNDLSHARSSGANGLPAYPVMGDNSSRQRRPSRQPRASFRVAQVESPEGFTTTVVSSGRDGSTRIVRRSQHQEDPLLSLMMHSLMSAGSPTHRGGRGGANIDRMSYEGLLAAFGDGTENMGASVETITSLPTAQVKTKNGKVDLPPDACQCAVCLEDFEGGDTRKTLPCLHGFHEGCIDKWLKTNGACPICKYRPDQSSNEHS